MNTPHQSQVSESRTRPRANFFAKTPLAQATAVAPEMTPASPSRQLRVTRPTAKLIDSNNHEKAALAFQRAAVDAEIARIEAAALAAAAATATPSPSTPSPQPTLSVTTSVTTREPSFTSTHESSSPSEIPVVIQGRKKRQFQVIVSSDEDEDDSDKAPKKKKKRLETKANCKFLVIV